MQAYNLGQLRGAFGAGVHAAENRSKDDDGMKACALCGQPESGNAMHSDKGWWVNCGNCDANGPLYPDRENAIKGWNNVSEAMGY